MNPGLKRFPEMMKTCFLVLLTGAILFGSSATVCAAVTPQIKVSGTHSLALQSDGTVLAWGDNSSGELGDGTTLERQSPVAVTGLTDVVAVAAGDYRSMAVVGDGTVWTWGEGSLAPTQSAGLADMTAVAAGFGHYVALKRDGTVWAWGSNSYGQVGDGTTDNRPFPQLVQGLGGVIAIAAGGNQTIALCSDGTVWAWGDNSSSQLGDGSSQSRAVPVRVLGLGGVVAIGMGINHTLALKGDGTVWAWGANNSGQLGEPAYLYTQSAPVQVSALSGVIAITTGGNHTLALKGDGTVWGWGSNYYGQLGDGTLITRTSPVQLVGLSGVSALGGGYFHSAALLTDGTVMVWGGNPHGQLGDGTADNHISPLSVAGLVGVRAVAAGQRHSLAAKNDGTVWFWGNNSAGQAGDGTLLMHPDPLQVSGLSAATSVAAAADRSLVLTGGGTVWSWGHDEAGNGSDIPTVVAGLADVVAIAVGPYPALAVKSNGTVMAWGDNAFGEVGDGSTTRRLTPVPVAALAGVLSVAAGSRHSLALKSDGTVWAWGRNNYGQLGDGTTIQRLEPVQVSGLAGVIAIAAGWQWSLALKSDGTVWAWGDNSWGKLGDGTTTERHQPVQVSGLAGVTAIAASLNVSLALKGDGTVWSWGAGVKLPALTATISGGTALAAGLAHNLVLRGDGTLSAWGDNSYGQLGDGIRSFFPKQSGGLNLGADVTSPVTRAYPGEGAYILPVSVALTADEPGEIHYTLDGTEPTVFSPVYAGPIPVTASFDLRYFARDLAGNSEFVKSSAYTVIPSHPLAVTFQGGGGGTVTIVGYGSCSGSCSKNVAAGENIIITASPQVDSVFTGWGGSCTGSSDCSLVMDGNRGVVAGFETACFLAGGPQRIVAEGFAPAHNAAGEIVWTAYDAASGANQIYSSSRGRLTSAPVQHDYPAINRYGDVVWSQYDPAFGTTIHGLIDGQERQLTFGSNDRYPSLSDSGELIYVGSDDQLHSIVRGRLTDSGFHYNPVANNNGDLVWEDSGQIYSLPFGVTTPVQVTSGTEYHAYPGLSDSGEIVWQQSVAGEERVFSSSRGQLTTCPGGSHMQPQLNACGDVVFSLYAAGGGGIYRFGTGSSCLPSSDNIRPYIASFSPPDGGSDVPLNAPVSILFSEAIDPTSVTDTSFSVQYGGGSIAGSYTTNGAMVTFQPAAQWAPATLYSVTVGSGVRDLAGNPLPLPLFWSFTTMGGIDIITAVTGNGAITCIPPYLYGETVNCSVTPAAGHRLQQFSNNGTNVTAALVNGVYTIAPFTETHYLEAVFVPDTYQLALTLSGSGSGVVAASPSVPGFQYDSGAEVTLTATSNTGSLFAGWTGCDTVNAFLCTVRMTAARSVTAAFTTSGLIKIDDSGTIYGTFNEIQQYIQPGALVRLKSGTVVEHILWTREIAAILSGGRDEDFNPTGSFTMLSGSLTIAAGTITVENLVIF